MKVIKVAYSNYDDKPLGHIIDNYVGYFNRPPEGYIEYIPNRIYDRRKYNDFYNIFFKDKLPTENEINCYLQKHNLQIKEKNSKKHLTIRILMIILALYLVLILLKGL